MSLPDGAEYWEKIYRHPRRVKVGKSKIPQHVCHPKNVPDGTPDKWRCPICRSRVNKKKYRFSKIKEART